MKAVLIDWEFLQVSDQKPDGTKGPHDPNYSLAKAAEMYKLADQATNEEDRQTFRALGEQWERMAKVAKRPHI